MTFMARGSQDIAYLRDLFDGEIKRIDQVLAERAEQTRIALDSTERALLKTEEEGLRARTAANEWRRALGERESVFVQQTSHNTLQSEVDYLRRSLDVGAGRRAAWIAAVGIIATLLAIGVGQIIRQGITASDVSGQIQREAPWNRDKAATEKRIAVLEKQQEALRVQVTRLQQRDEFFCVTRASAGLPGC